MLKNLQKVLIYYTNISENATPDDKDVVDERDFVLDVLNKVGYEVETRKYDLLKVKKIFNEIRPSFIFNLVESIDGKDSLAYLAPVTFEKLGIPYTGCTKDAFLKTASKVNSKITLRQNGILTPYWITLRDLERENLPKKKFLIKSTINHASKDLEATLLDGADEVREVLRYKGRDFFAEEYIEGREFNISIIGKLGEGKVLPIPEMQFMNWPHDKLKIVDYKAKWDDTSIEYNNTERTFNFSEQDKPMLEKLGAICKKCWKLFNLRGYARVDFRVDKDNKPYVLEINANPCISPGAGFIAACRQEGMSDDEAIRGIIRDSCGEKFVL